jgi:hypothetical protein
MYREELVMLVVLLGCLCGGLTAVALSFWALT